MLPKSASSPFGSQTRTRILLAIRLLESTFPRELSRLLESPIFAVRKALAALERDGLVSARLVGRTRVYTLNPAYIARHELGAFLSRLADNDPELRARIARLRPAAAGQPVSDRFVAQPPLVLPTVPVPAPPARTLADIPTVRVTAPAAPSPTRRHDAPAGSRPRRADGWKNW